MERVLLYAVAIVLGGLLVFDGDHLRGNADTDASRQQERHSGREVIEESSAILADASGLSRIESRLTKDGTAELVLNDRFGEPVIRLAAGAEDSGEIRIARGSRSASLLLQPDGGLSLSLNGPAETGVVVAATARGDVSLHLKSIDGGKGQIFVSRNGETEMSITSRSNGMEALMRTDAAGGAELAIQDPTRKRRTSLAMLPEGETGLSIRGGGRDSQLSLKLFEDGLGEIAIRGPEGEGGPHMLRLPDGTAAVSARRSDGTPGASLVCTPTGDSALSMADREGVPRAMLRLTEDGRPELAVPDPAVQDRPSPDGKPERPKNSPKRRRPAKPDIGILGISETDWYHLPIDWHR
ncbi:MAG: hypothetical protein KDA79_17880 [Planctomycetaceae bacterium]|nr:hypothetical protein [Planctomycetaceae bacterium]